MILDRLGRYVHENELWRQTHDRDGGVVAAELVAENSALMMYSPFLPAAPAADQSA